MNDNIAMVMSEIVDYYGYIEIDYIFEDSDGGITNIQFNEDSKQIVKEYKNEADFLETLDPELKSIKDFYNEIEFVDSNFKFIGYADGYDAHLFI